MLASCLTAIVSTVMYFDSSFRYRKEAKEVGKTPKLFSHVSTLVAAFSAMMLAAYKHLKGVPVGYLIVLSTLFGVGIAFMELVWIRKKLNLKFDQIFVGSVLLTNLAGMYTLVTLIQLAFHI